MVSRKATITVCDRDGFGKERPATQERVFALEDRYYKLELCDEHAKMFDREVGAWARLAAEIDTPDFARPRSQFFLDERARETARIRELSQKAKEQAAVGDFATKRAAAMAAQVEADVAAESEARSRKLIPGGMKWRLTDHARERAEQRGYTVHDVLEAAARPDHTYASVRDPELTIHERAGCRVVVDGRSCAIITVIDRNDRSEVALTPTQERLAQ
jgi:hypothetical protein